jgi:regulator of extracellular matrix RemA (YlzA/DUF370 family)
MAFGALVSILLTGCGSTKSYTATDQLLLSDAVDTTIAKLDFSPLRDQKVYLDITYLKTQRSQILIDSDYVISSIRQQMVGDGVKLVEGRDEADVIAEARLGALGLDGHTVTYGIPASNLLTTASAAFVNAPPVPALPEMSFGKYESKLGAAKIAVFAYKRETREPVWQSGIAQSSSNAKDTWVLGIGPFQRGSIHSDTKFAGDDIAATDLLKDPKEDIHEMEPYKDYKRSRVFPALFEGLNEKTTADAVVTADGQGEAQPDSAAKTGKPAK